MMEEPVHGLRGRSRRIRRVQRVDVDPSGEAIEVGLECCQPGVLVRDVHALQLQTDVGERAVVPERVEQHLMTRLPGDLHRHVDRQPGLLQDLGTVVLARPWRPRLPPDGT